VRERNEWLDALNSAIEDYRSRKATFLSVDQMGAALTNSGGGGHQRSQMVVGDAAPVWVPDQRVTMCQLCSLEFGLVNRRHHCRACGKSFLKLKERDSLRSNKRGCSHFFVIALGKYLLAPR
jgi:hypothetical protein